MKSRSTVIISHIPTLILLAFLAAGTEAWAKPNPLDADQASLIPAGSEFVVLRHVDIGPDEPTVYFQGGAPKAFDKLDSGLPMCRVVMKGAVPFRRFLPAPWEVKKGKSRKLKLEYSHVQEDGSILLVMADSDFSVSMLSCQHNVMGGVGTSIGDLKTSLGHYFQVPVPKPIMATGEPKAQIKSLGTALAVLNASPKAPGAAATGDHMLIDRPDALALNDVPADSQHAFVAN